MTSEHLWLEPLPDGNVLIPRNQMPRHTGYASQTWAKWACEGRGLRQVRIGRKVYYRASDVREWLESQNSPQT
ncbi:hypothetical protein AA309_05515 [Microvirga vignae]|uniref:Helix-turn-helix domain-containing protein n=1 Tax=Microvirga vignae TaxID=1225564 RepID=A0A0H1RFW3_9HYPH|nr:hypothetical protein AA309_05515 [Microvirga vignae]